MELDDELPELPTPPEEIARVEVPPEGFCCADMERAVAAPCHIHGPEDWCADRIVHYTAKFDEYGIPVLDGGSSVIGLVFCPWCGRRLPPSQRDRWFAEIEALGIDPWSDDEPVPPRFESAAWRLDTPG